MFHFRKFILVMCLLTLVFACKSLFATIHPIQFGISEKKIVDTIPEKDLDFATIIPGDSKTYIYDNEEDYYKGYQRAYYAITCKKAGWDCMRHYEILANGCIPYFIDLDKCDPNIMTFFPKELVWKAMHLPGVYQGKIDHAIFDKEQYFAILNELLNHTRKFLTTKALAQYILDTVGYSGQGKILYLSTDSRPDYLRCTLLEGFKDLLKERVIDVPKIEHICLDYQEDIHKLYGKGISYTKLQPDLPIDRSLIKERIKNEEFDLIIYGSVHRGMPYYGIVTLHYTPDRVITLCGEDSHDCKYTSRFKNFFLRELESRYLREER